MLFYLLILALCGFRVRTIVDSLMAIAHPDDYDTTTYTLLTENTSVADCVCFLVFFGVELVFVLASACFKDPVTTPLAAAELYAAKGAQWYGRDLRLGVFLFNFFCACG